MAASQACAVMLPNPGLSSNVSGTMLATLPAVGAGRTQFVRPDPPGADTAGLAATEAHEVEGPARREHTPRPATEISTPRRRRPPRRPAVRAHRPRSPRRASGPVSSPWAANRAKAGWGARCATARALRKGRPHPRPRSRALRPGPGGKGSRQVPPSVAARRLKFRPEARVVVEHKRTRIADPETAEKQASGSFPAGASAPLAMRIAASAYLALTLAAHRPPRAFPP